MTLYKAPDTSSIDRELDRLDDEIERLQGLRKEAHRDTEIARLQALRKEVNRQREQILLEPFEALPEVAVERIGWSGAMDDYTFRLIRWSKTSIWLSHCAEVCASNPRGAGIRFRRKNGEEYGGSSMDKITDLAAVEALIAAEEGAQ